MTHSSAVKAVANNERLEFLGDRVLGLIVAELVFSRFPEAREGEIARERERLQGALLSSISHEFRTPLATITGVLSALREADKR